MIEGQTIPRKVRGVYRLRHKPSGSAYVGSSNRCIGNRYSWHAWALRKEVHGCKELQSLWNRTEECEWAFEVLEECDIGGDRAKETFWLQKEKQPLNGYSTASGKGESKHTEETRRKQRESRARYLQTPGARESLSERAKDQHKSGKLGQSTWTDKSKDLDWLKTDEARERARDQMGKLVAEGKMGPDSWKHDEATGKRGVSAFFARMTPEERTAWGKRASEARYRKTYT